MARADAVPDEQGLRRGVADLIAFTALPATWTDHDPQHVAGNVAAALSSILGLEFVYVSSPGRRDEPAIEVTQLRSGDHQDLAGLIYTTLAELLMQRVSGKIIIHLVKALFRSPHLLSDPKVTPRSLQDPGTSGSPPRPRGSCSAWAQEKIAAGLHRWQAEIDRRHFVALLEKSSNLIGFASLEGVMQYINPAGLAQVGLDKADDMRGLRVFDLILSESGRGFGGSLAQSDPRGEMGGEAVSGISRPAGHSAPARMVRDRRLAYWTGDECWYHQPRSFCVEALGIRTART